MDSDAPHVHRRDRNLKSESVMIAALEVGVPLLVEVGKLVAAFVAMICKKIVGKRKP